MGHGVSGRCRRHDLPYVRATTAIARAEEQRLAYVGPHPGAAPTGCVVGRHRSHRSAAARRRISRLSVPPPRGRSGASTPIGTGTSPAAVDLTGSGRPPARCRVCGRALVTGRERTLGRCDTSGRRRRHVVDGAAGMAYRRAHENGDPGPRDRDRRHRPGDRRDPPHDERRTVPIPGMWSYQGGWDYGPTFLPWWPHIRSQQIGVHESRNPPFDLGPNRHSGVQLTGHARGSIQTRWIRAWDTGRFSFRPTVKSAPLGSFTRVNSPRSHSRE